MPQPLYPILPKVPATVLKFLKNCCSIYVYGEWVFIPERGCRFSWTSLVCPGEMEEIRCKGKGGNVLGFSTHSCVFLPVRSIVKVSFHGFPEVWYFWRNQLDVVTIVDFRVTEMLHESIESMKKYFWPKRVLVSQAYVLGLVIMKDHVGSQLVRVRDVRSVVCLLCPTRVMVCRELRRESPGFDSKVWATVTVRTLRHLSFSMSDARPNGLKKLSVCLGEDSTDRGALKSIYFDFCFGWHVVPSRPSSFIMSKHFPDMMGLLFSLVPTDSVAETSEFEYDELTDWSTPIRPCP
ncbi:hypothetical protein V6N13_083283 [Hibiscus sabdariffa]|uniref:Uncharacterized protein n=1 Tax=Hibiscus sabdariffa TaxID=183260 RepID=A0ABR2SXK1_9ROSI